MKTRFIRVLSGFVLGLTLLACSHHITPSAKLGAMFRDDFSNALRWKQFKVASEHMQPEIGKAFMAKFSEMKDLNIADVRLVDVQSYDGESRFDATFEMDYFILPSVTLKTFRFEQSWEFLTEPGQVQGRYVIVTPFPDFP